MSTRHWVLFAGLMTTGCEALAPDERGSDLESVAREVRVPDTRVGFGGPGGAYFNGNLHLTFTGTDHRMNVIRNVGGNWFKVIPALWTNVGTSIAPFEGRLHGLGVDMDGLGAYLRSDDGDFWYNVPPVRFRPSRDNCLFRNDPALIVHAGVLIAFISVYCDQSPESIRQYNLSGDTWTEVNWFTDARTRESPSISELDNQVLVLSWIGTDGRLNSKRHIPWQGWTAVHTIPWNGVPHITRANTSPGSLIMASRSTANIGPNQIEFYRSNDGMNWSFAGRSVHTTFARPFVLSADGASVEFAHVGTDGNRTLNWNRHWF